MIGTLSVIACIAVTLFALFRALNITPDDRGDYEPRPTVSRVVSSAVLIVSVWIIGSSIGQVSEGERGVVLRFGAATGRVIEPGAYFVMPFVETVQHMSVRTEAESIKAEGASKDLQIIHAEITVNYSLDPASCVEVYRTLRDEALRRVVKPAIEESVKAATADFKAEELITHRTDVKDRIANILRSRLRERGFLLDAINVTDFDFSQTFNESIEAKVTATQAALKAENDLVRVRAEAQQQVARAQAEAEALKAQREAVTPELIELRRVEAQLKAVEKWDGKLPTYVGASGAPVPMLDVFQPGGK